MRKKLLVIFVLTMLLLVVVSPIGVSVGVVDSDGGYALAGDTHIWHIETVDTEGDAGRDSSIALDSSDSPHISYYYYAGSAPSDSGIRHAYYDGTWHIENVDSSGVGYGTDIALDSSDNPHISYLGFWPPDYIGLKYAYYDGSWHIETVDSGDSPGANVGLYSSIALDSSNSPHISYFDAPNWDLKYAYYDGSWHIETVDSEGDVGEHTSIALDSNDYPHISYLDDTNRNLKYAYYDGTWHIETADDSGYVGWEATSIALDSSDNPHISYYDWAWDHLKYARKDSTWHIETVDSADYVGFDSSIALDSSDSPHISYHDRTNTNLKYAYYDGSWHIETVDSEGDVGEHTSIALDSSDSPHISYQGNLSDPFYGDLKYAWGEPACTLTITATSGGTTNPAPGTYPYICGSSVEVTAIPDTDYVFDHWELDASWNYSNPTSVTMDSDHTLHAVFNYDVTIQAYCYTEGEDVSVSIDMDGSPTGYTTPHTFTGLTGTHTFTVPDTDPHDHLFKQWSTDETNTTITVTTGGTYTAYYEQLPYDVTIQAYCYTEGEDVSVSIDMDGSPTGYTTPHTFTGLTGTHTFTVPDTDPHDCPFRGWSTGETSTTITVTTGGTYTAYYGLYVHDVAVTDVTFSKTVVGQGYCMNITVTVENQGDFLEWFGVAAPYFDGVVMPTPEQWETFWSMGDCSRDGYIDITDYDIIDDNWLWEGPPGENPADINSDGIVNLWDSLIYAGNYGLDIWTHFGLPTPPIGTQRGVRLHPGNQTTITFTWNTTGMAKGNYTITAYAWPVQGEADTTDNTLINGWVVVTIPGDVDGDRDVDIYDVVKITGIYGSKRGDPQFKANSDLDCDGEIKIYDVVKCTAHYGDKDP